jgi:urease accessory protein
MAQHPLSFSPARNRLLRPLAASLALLPGAAWAHHAEFMQDRPFLQGLSMPVHGLDHLLAALATGALASRLSPRNAAVLVLLMGGVGLLGGLLNLRGMTLPECTLCALLAVLGGFLFRKGALSAGQATAALGALFVANAAALAELAPAASTGNTWTFATGCGLAILSLVAAGFLGTRVFSGLFQTHNANRYVGGALFFASALLWVFPSANEFLIRWVEGL